AAGAAASFLCGCSSYSPTTSAMEDAATMHPYAPATAPRLVAGDPLGGALVHDTPQLLTRARVRQADTDLAGAEPVTPPLPSWLPRRQVLPVRLEHLARPHRQRPARRRAPLRGERQPEAHVRI